MKTATEMKDALKELRDGLTEDLLKSTRSDNVYIEDDFIVIEIPKNINFGQTTEYLIPIINASMTKQHANRAAVKITNGRDVKILSWGF